ncbi:HAMP domain-containing protein [Epibacterium ulvae]|uniref:methyl-accepting chemotaxis protein n=1 Tax=Epibacterium ulvae TaxID=1156985 RepID=UPI001BFC980F|nr:methyl-accepting chemotaxis protein [Epibacterium ulvae]MBT8153192.1 HAMP domain-containing protein [Epibacterium ulvae]
MNVKLFSRDGWLMRAMGSIGAKIFLILFAMGTTSAVGGLMITSAFDRITVNVRNLTENDLPTLAQTSDVSEAVSQAQKALINLLLASDDEELQIAHAGEADALHHIEEILPQLQSEETQTFHAELMDVNKALKALVENRSHEFVAAEQIDDQVTELARATIAAQRQLTRAAQDAKVRMRTSSQKIVGFMDSSLKNMVEREFAAIQILMQLRTDVALLAVDSLEIETAQTPEERAERIKTAQESLGQTVASLQAVLDNPAIRDELIETQTAVAAWAQLIKLVDRPHAEQLHDAELQQYKADAELAGQVEHMMMMLQFASEHVGASNLESTNELFGNEVNKLLQLLNINNRLALFRSTSLELVVMDNQQGAILIGKRLPGLYKGLLKAISKADVTLHADAQEKIDALVAEDGGILDTKIYSLNARDAARDASLAAAIAMTGIAETATKLSQSSRDGISNIAGEISGDVGNATDRLNTIMIVTTAVIVLGIFFTFQFILRPLVRLSETTERLAGGDMSPVKGFNRAGTEISRIARALTVFRDGLVEKDETEERVKTEREARQAQQTLAVNSLATGLERLSEGDLTARVTEELEGGYKKLRDDFNAAVERLEQSVRVVSNSGRSIVGNSSDISTLAQDLSQKSAETADTLAETASSLSRLSESITGTAKASSSVSVSVQEAHTTATSSIKVVDETITAMRDLQTSSEKIAQIIGVIDGIAQQTNLLALNAGVEAARAGSVGKGFAVVASEVRQLANKSKEAANEISHLVRESSEQVEMGSELVQRTGQAMSEISETVSNAANRMSEIASAAEEQSGDLQSINHAMIGLDNTTKTNDQLFQGVTQSSVGLSEEAQAMQEAIDRFRVGSTNSVVREDAQDQAFLSAMS